MKINSYKKEREEEKKEQVDGLKSLTHIDLFSGIGGFSLAAQWANIETVQFVEIDLFCQKVLKKNFPEVPKIAYEIMKAIKDIS